MRFESFRLVYSFYPLFPPALATPLDLSLAPSALELATLPDVLILPSDLAPFVKVSFGCVLWLPTQTASKTRF